MTKRTERFLTVIAALVISLVIGAAIMMMFGTSPIEGYYQMINSIAGSAFGIGSTLERFVPILLTGLAFVVAMKANIANMGVEGSLYLGAMASAVVAVYLPDGIPGFLVIFLSILAALIAGGLWALIPAMLKLELNVNEILSTILLNYVAINFTDYLVNGPLHGGGTSPQTAQIMPQAELTKILPPSMANTGLFIAIVTVVLVYLYFKYTTSGYKIKQVGENPYYSETMGFKPKKQGYIAMFFSGALGGLAGSLEVLGVYGLFLGGFSNQIAFDGMLAGLIAGSSYIALSILSLFIAALKIGALGMQRFTSIPSSLIDTIIGIFILLATVNKISGSKIALNRANIRTFFKPGNKDKRKGEEAHDI